MASIRVATANVIDTARDGISWICFWKEGRGWNSTTIYGVDYNERTNTATIEDNNDIEEMKKIVTIDRRAIMVNSYIHNLGVIEEQVTIERLANFLKWHYELQHYTLYDFIELIK